MELEKVINLKQLLNFALEPRRMEIETEQPTVKIVSSSSTTAENISSYRLDQKQREDVKAKARAHDKKSKSEVEAKPSVTEGLRADADGFFIYEKCFTAHKYGFIENENMLLLGVFKDKKKSGYSIPTKAGLALDFDRDHMEYLEQLGQLSNQDEPYAGNQGTGEEDLFQEIMFSVEDNDEFFHDILHVKENQILIKQNFLNSSFIKRS